eukprot:scaffold461_cov130-Skeletonema_menzelii.AAC.3
MQLSILCGRALAHYNQKPSTGIFGIKACGSEDVDFSPATIKGKYTFYLTSKHFHNFSPPTMSEIYIGASIASGLMPTN